MNEELNKEIAYGVNSYELIITLMVILCVVLVSIDYMNGLEYDNLCRGYCEGFGYEDYTTNNGCFCIGYNTNYDKLNVTIEPDFNFNQ